MNNFMVLITKIFKSFKNFRQNQIKTHKNLNKTNK
jgi:hypothetical protein